MNQLFSDDVALVSGGNPLVLGGIALWLYENQEDVGRFFDAAFEAYHQNQQAHK